MKLFDKTSVKLGKEGGFFLVNLIRLSKTKKETFVVSQRLSFMIDALNDERYCYANLL